VFEHALRIRLKAQVPDTPADAAVDIEPTGLVVGSTVEGGQTVLAGEEGEQPPVSESSPEAGSADSSSSHSKGTTAVSVASSSGSTVVGSSSSSAKGKDKDSKKGKKDEKKKEKSDNLLGKLNNLVTSDLSNITSGRDFLFVVLNAPIQFALGITFLYAILGWSSFVGLAVMVALMPVPAWVATFMQGVQKQKMEAVSHFSLANGIAILT
jgi:hypothetical protein